jgi:hypothetical protein
MKLEGFSSMADANIPTELDPGRILTLLPGELEDLIRDRSREELAEWFGSDKWLHNYVLSIWEKSRRETALAIAQ